MARLEQSYAGEFRTASVTVQLTPSERAQLEQRAAEEGARLSAYMRDLCLRRSGAAGIVAGTRRNPEAKALMAELRAIGNNLNQLARHANTTEESPATRELRAILGTLKIAMARVIAL